MPQRSILVYTAKKRSYQINKIFIISVELLEKRNEFKISYQQTICTKIPLITYEIFYLFMWCVYLYLCIRNNQSKYLKKKHPVAYKKYLVGFGTISRLIKSNKLSFIISRDLVTPHRTHFISIIIFTTE